MQNPLQQLLQKQLVAINKVDLSLIFPAEMLVNFKRQYVFI